MKTFKRLSVGLFALTVSSIVFAQRINTPLFVEDYTWDLDRFIDQDSSSLNLHYTIKDYGKHKFRILNPVTKLNFNSDYPVGYNDGAVWKGRGFNGELHFGVSGSIGMLHYTIQPVAFFSQNRSFILQPQTGTAHPLNYQFNKYEERIYYIDWVQRYGNDLYAQFFLGQSEIKLSKFGFQVVFGTQNYKVGPASTFPIILSNNGPGMPKLNIGTDGPQEIEIGSFKPGRLEFNVIYARMNESDYFDDIPDNNRRFFNGYFLAYHPSFVKNLTVGFNRVHYKQTRYKDSLDWLAIFYSEDEPIQVVNGDTLRSQNDFFDQMASINMEWKFPSVGFRAYAEYALNDRNGGRIRYMVEPEHSRAYLIGFQKLFEMDKVNFLLGYEHINLSRNQTYLWRAEPPYYAHEVNRQGYTNNGQVIGASIGPGGNADQLDLKFTIPNIGLVFGAFGRRIEFNKDYFVTHDPSFGKHDAEYTTGATVFWDRKDLIYGFEGSYSYDHNRYYIQKNNHDNFYFGLSLQYKVSE
ncbi:MAG: capsule assembly Wzi family protein [Marinoscillum sp.]